MKLEYNGHKIDETSQRTLLTLEETSPQIASDIAAQLGIENPELVRYRMQNYLIPAGLVKKVGTKKVKGGEATLYAITESAIKANENAPRGFGKNDTVADLREDIESLQQQVENLVERVNKEKQRIDDRATRQSLHRTQENLEDRLFEFECRLEQINTFKNRMEENFGEQTEKLEKQAEQIGEIRTKAKRSDKQINNRVNDIKRTVDEEIERIDQIEERLKEIEDGSILPF